MGENARRNGVAPWNFNVTSVIGDEFFGEVVGYLLVAPELVVWSEEVLDPVEFSCYSPSLVVVKILELE